VVEYYLKLYIVFVNTEDLFSYVQMFCCDVHIDINIIPIFTISLLPTSDGVVSHMFININTLRF